LTGTWSKTQVHFHRIAKLYSDLFGTDPLQKFVVVINDVRKNVIGPNIIFTKLAKRLDFSQG